MKGLSVTTPPLKELFPVGSIYINVNTTNPGTIFGGTWEQIKDKFLLCSGNTYSNGSTGGNASHTHTTQGHTLTIDEIPSHAHGTRINQGGTIGYIEGNYTYIHQSASTQPTDATGGSQAHAHGNTDSSSSLPPYLAVTVWKRIA